MLRSLIACCVIGSCLALVGCEASAEKNPADNATSVAKETSGAEKAATKPGDQKKSGKDKATRKKKPPHVTTAK